MTGYTVHTGSSKKFAQGWDQIFKGKTAATSAKSASKTAGKKKPAPTSRKTK